MAGAAFFSMFAILGVMREAKGSSGELVIPLSFLAGITILLSWLAGPYRLRTPLRA